MKKLSLKQKNFANNIIKAHKEGKGESMYKMAIKAGYAVSTARTPQTITNKPSFKTYLNKHGMTDDWLAKKMKDFIDVEPEGAKSWAVQGNMIQFLVKTKTEPDQRFSQSIGFMSGLLKPEFIERAKINLSSPRNPRQLVDKGPEIVEED